MSSTIFAATCSATDPSSLPGKIRFMSRSNIGIPRDMESTPRGLMQGKSQRFPSNVLFVLLKCGSAHSRRTGLPASSPWVPVTTQIRFSCPVLCSGSITCFKIRKFSSTASPTSVTVFIVASYFTFLPPLLKLSAAGCAKEAPPVHGSIHKIPAMAQLDIPLIHKAVMSGIQSMPKLTIPHLCPGMARSLSGHHPGRASHLQDS